MDNRLKQLKANMHHSLDEAVQKVTEKAKWEKGFGFRKKGHRELHEPNEHVRKCLEEATGEMVRKPCTDSVLDNARQGVDEWRTMKRVQVARLKNKTAMPKFHQPGLLVPVRRQILCRSYHPWLAHAIAAARWGT